MTIRNRIVGFLLGREITVQQLMNKPEIAQDPKFLNIEKAKEIHYPPAERLAPTNIDNLFRHLTCETMSYNVSASVPTMHTTTDWKCNYCGCLRPYKEYECGHCGAPRTEKKEESGGWEPDESQIGSLDI